MWLELFRTADPEGPVQCSASASSIASSKARRASQPALAAAKFELVNSFKAGHLGRL